MLVASGREWYHVPGSENAADRASRLKSSNYLGLHSEWMRGAACLKKPVEEWPINRSFAEKNLKYPSHIRRLGNSEVKLKQLGRFSRDKVW